MSEAAVLAAYRATGRVAIERPRKGTISLNGGRDMPRADAIARMRECLAAQATALDHTLTQNRARNP